MIRSPFIAIGFVALAGLAACGGDDTDAQTAAAVVTPAADPQRYCALTRELDADGEKFFTKLGRDAGPEEFEAAERRFVESSSDKLTELEQVAPPQIKADVQTILTALRQRAGLQSARKVSESEASGADKSVKAYEKRECRA